MNCPLCRGVALKGVGASHRNDWRCADASCGARFIVHTPSRLFDAPPPPRHPPRFGPTYPTGAGVQRSSDTSAAAGLLVSTTLRKRQQDVYRALERRGRAIADDLCADLGLPRNSVAPRLTELHERGLVTDTGERRKTPAGAWATVYEVIFCPGISPQA